MHAVVGTDHPSAFALLVYRVCDLFQLCIEATNIRIVVHSRSNEQTEGAVSVDEFFRFLSLVNVTHRAWSGEFSADAKMKQSFLTLEGLHSHSQVVLQMDVDEEPEPKRLLEALKEMDRNECDAVRAVWRDRIALNGNLSQVRLETQVPLRQQFPLVCDVSGRVVSRGMTYKTIAFRADSRLDGGQHDVWCDRSGRESDPEPEDMSIPWNKTLACVQHTHDRAKSKLLPLVLANVANLKQRPRYCHTIVPLFHYKFVAGVKRYLEKRMHSYRKQGLHWWRDSKRFLEHLQKHENRVCVECKETKCSRPK